MRYAQIREMDISNGEGVGISLFVQGCHFHCPGCFNQETWDFSGGSEWTPELEKKFIELAGKHFVKRISFLGGEPLDDENVADVYRIICILKGLYPNKKIWIYTGYTWEEIIEQPVRNNLRLSTVLSADILADGRFDISKQDINHKKVLWVGSTNQRVIDIKETLKKIIDKGD